MNLLAVAKELQSIISQDTSQRVTTYSVLPERAEFPCVVVEHPETIRYAVTFGGRSEIDWPISVYCKAGDTDSAWSLLYSLVSFAVPDPAPSSVVDALINAGPFTNFKALHVGQGDFEPFGDGTVKATITLTLTLV